MELGKEVEVFTLKNLYEELAEIVEPLMSKGSEFSSPAYLRLIDALGHYAGLLNCYPLYPPKQPVGVGAQDRQALVDIVKGVVRAAWGDNLNTAYIFYSIVNSAVNREFTGRMSAVLLGGLTEEEKDSLNNSLFPGRPAIHHSFEEGDLPDKSMALKIYRKICDRFYKSNRSTETSDTQQTEPIMDNKKEQTDGV